MQILFIIVLLIYVFSIIYYYKNRKKLFEKYIKRKKHEIEEQISKRTIYKDSLEYVIESREKNLQVLEDCLRQGQHQKEVLFKELEEYEKQQMETINHHVEIIKEIKTNEALNQLEKERKQAEAECDNKCNRWLQGIYWSQGLCRGQEFWQSIHFHPCSGVCTSPQMSHNYNKSC